MKKMPSIVFKSNGILFSIPSNNVQAIISLPEVTTIPNVKFFVRGIVKHRNKIYSVLDFRALTNQPNIVDQLEEFRKMLDQRETDHVNWLIELEKSVVENRAFNLATDPHKCAFGKWYDNYETRNLTILKILHKFDKPHKSIHQIAEKIELLKKNGQFEESKLLIENTRTKELATMKSLFKQLKKDSSLVFQESAILLENNSQLIALSVEKIISVEDIQKKETQNLDSSNLLNFDDSLISGLGESESYGMIIMLNEDLLAA